jgi:CubicO group peptidase (beta-lactamase class C family)
MTPRDAVPVEGYVAPGYEAVRQAFERNFALHGDVGASCAVHDGHGFVVDLWGGSARADRPWSSDTICLAYSVTKGLVTVLLARLVEEGLLDLDQRVAAYWPEFGAAGKGATTVRMVLSHRAGLPVIEPGLDRAALMVPGAAAERLAEQSPAWDPGTSFSYHALTWGWLVDELVFRITGQRVREQLEERVARPLGLEVYVGLPPGALPRVADLVVHEDAGRSSDDAPTAALSAAFEAALTANGAFPVLDVATWNDDAVRLASLPGANAITNARSAARVYAAVATDSPDAFVSRRTVQDFRLEQSVGTDQVTGFHSRFGAGFMLPTAGNPMYSASSFGHEGVGGAQAFADLDAGLGFAFVQNSLLSVGGGDPRVQALVDAVRRARQQA